MSIRSVEVSKPRLTKNSGADALVIIAKLVAAADSLTMAIAKANEVQRRQLAAKLVRIRRNIESTTDELRGELP